SLTLFCIRWISRCPIGELAWKDSCGASARRQARFTVIIAAANAYCSQPMPHSPTDAPQDGDADDLYDRPSKSQVKREMLALTDLGKQLVDLPPERLRKLALEEKLHEAIRLAQRTTSREGRRRQIHYVGKLM